MDRKEPLNLSHQTILKTHLQKLNLPIAEYSFANLYLFRHVHKYEVIFADGLFIRGQTRDGRFFIMLTSLPQPRLLSQLGSLLQKAEADFIFPVPEEWLPLFMPYLTQANFKEEESDYLYYTTKLAHYPGRHLSKKRNLVKQLLSSHHMEAQVLQPDQKELALQVLEKWQKEQTEDKKKTDYFACREALELLKELSLEAHLFYVDGQPEGFTIGEGLNKDCYVIHFSKADKHIKGLYQYLYQEPAKLLVPFYQWMNLEQDLGSLALRLAKHSYQPDRLVHKMRVSL